MIKYNCKGVWLRQWNIIIKSWLSSKSLGYYRRLLSTTGDEPPWLIKWLVQSLGPLSCRMTPIVYEAAYSMPRNINYVVPTKRCNIQLDRTSHHYNIIPFPVILTCCYVSWGIDLYASIYPNVMWLSCLLVHIVWTGLSLPCLVLPM